jgi:hypothetical protein
LKIFIARISPVKIQFYNPHISTISPPIKKKQQKKNKTQTNKKQQQTKQKTDMHGKIGSQLVLY